jgi:hypothetical protein
MEKIFVTAASEKNGEEAVKEVSLKIKAVFPRAAKHILVFYTPHYQPLTILKTIQYTLKPDFLTGVEAPALIFEDNIIEKGIVACCINNEKAFLKNTLIKNTSSADIELAMRKALHDFAGEKHFVFSFIPPHFNYSQAISGLKIALGKNFNMSGAGYVKKYAPRTFNIIDKTVDEGMLNILGRGLDVESYKISGFMPLGKPFTITKVLARSNVITEINNQPAINIYKKYLEEKFDAFKKNRLFPIYPLRVMEEGKARLVSVLDSLEDGSLVCMEEVKENCRANLTILHPPSLFEKLEYELEPLKNSTGGLLFITNSFIRKKILKDNAQEELRLINKHLGQSFKIIGIYSDYCFCPSYETGEVGIENGPLLLSAWR